MSTDSTLLPDQLTLTALASDTKCTPFDSRWCCQGVIQRSLVGPFRTRSIEWLRGVQGLTMRTSVRPTVRALPSLPDAATVRGLRSCARYCMEAFTVFML